MRRLVTLGLTSLLLTAAVTIPETAEAGRGALYKPKKAKKKAPDVYRVHFQTTKGSIVIEVHREWAPHGADRFYNLVRVGFYDDVTFYRAIAGFMVQFGLTGDPKVNKAWKPAKITDDPVTQSNTRGRISFAMAGPNTRTTQVFINYGDNSHLDGMGFAPFGEVVEGMEVLDALHTGYGEGAPRGEGPSQKDITLKGDAYLADFPLLDRLQRARIE